LCGCAQFGVCTTGVNRISRRCWMAPRIHLPPWPELYTANASVRIPPCACLVLLLVYASRIGLWGTGGRAVGAPAGAPPWCLVAVVMPSPPSAANRRDMPAANHAGPVPLARTNPRICPIPSPSSVPSLRPCSLRSCPGRRCFLRRAACSHRFPCRNPSSISAATARSPRQPPASNPVRSAWTASRRSASGAGYD
jgi:hypothetical protein